MLGAAPAAGFGGVVLDTGILDCMVTLVDEHGDVWSPTFMGRIHSGKAELMPQNLETTYKLHSYRMFPTSQTNILLWLIIQQSIQSWT